MSQNTDIKIKRCQNRNPNLKISQLNPTVGFQKYTNRNNVLFYDYDYLISL